MERRNTNEEGRRKFAQEEVSAQRERTSLNALPKAVIRQAGRYRAIESAQKELCELRQTTIPSQEDQSYTAVDKVETYAGNIACKIIQPQHHPHHVQRENMSHDETHFYDKKPLRTPTPKDLMRQQMVQKVKNKRAEADRERLRNLSHSETSFKDNSPLTASPKEQMRHSFLQKVKRKKNEEANAVRTSSALKENNLTGIRKKGSFHGEESTARDPAHVRINSLTERYRPSMGQRQMALPQNTSSEAKAQFVKKQGRRLAQSKAARQVMTGSKKSGNDIFLKLGAAIINVVRAGSDNLIINAGLALAIIVPLIMLAGIAVALFGSGEHSNAYVPVSAEVEAYSPIIQLYANQYGIPEYTELIKAVMMQESGGQGTDPMQCSESGYNTRYPHAPNSITDPEYSIEVGVQSLANVIQMADVESPIDLERISLALQGYNFGDGYISWALANYGGYSELNAIEFSDMMAARYGWAGYGDKVYVSHVLRYYPIGRSFMGEGNAAMVAVAQAQFGNEGGLKFCNWYGYDFRVEWCAIFVSWCADQCGYLDAGVLPRMEGVIPFEEWFVERGQWQSRDYEPMPGDIIFFDWESDGLPDHIGIVEKLENGLIYTVEGNTGDMCAERCYTPGSAPVRGFGLPLY